jgi:hypothetical protein
VFGFMPKPLQAVARVDSPGVIDLLAVASTETSDATAGGMYAWEAEANPIIYTRTGVRSFFIDETGILLGDDLPDYSGSMSMPEF